VFGFASQMERKIQFGPDVLCEFDWFERGGFVLRPVQNSTSFGHNAIVRSLGQ
jgi:hypothetical protein